jgi:hypothetical protein
MLQFETIFKNQFANKNISDDNLKKFAEDHLQRMIAKNSGGTFTLRITDTTTAYTNYFGSMSDEDIALSFQQSLTMTNDNLLDLFKKTVSQKEGTIRGFYNKGTPEYEAFFPHGLTEYSNALKANVETLMTRMIAVSTAHVVDLGAPFVATFTTIKTNYVNARTAQLLKIGEVDDDKTGTADSRDALETELMKNLFFVGFTFPGNVTACMDFFKQDIIRYDVDSSTDNFGRLTGLIKDAITGTPIMNATLKINDTNTPIAKANIDGRYKTQRTAIGPVVVTVKATGKAYKTFNVTIVDDGDTTFDVDM